MAKPKRTLKALPKRLLVEGAEDITFLSERQVCAMLGVSRVGLYLWRRKGTFPEPTKLGVSKNGWSLAALRAWRDGLRPAKVSPKEEPQPAA